MTAEAPALAAPTPLWRRLLNHGSFLAGATLFGAVVLVALLADVISPLDPMQTNFRTRLKPPSELNWLGTDRGGRDVLSRIIHGSRVSLRIGLLVVLFTGFFGALIGGLAGYFRALDNIVMRVMDAMMAFPGILLAIAIAAILGPSEFNAVIALSITYTPRTARVARAAVLVVREMPYVEAARAVGASHARILLTHILPNSLTPLVVQLTYIFALAILAEAVLSFIGVGPPPPAPTFGNIIADGRDFIQEAAWVTFFPGMAIAVAVLGLNLIGDGLRDALDPRMKVDLR
jgi:peptide/nickel transport system permease protein